VKDKYMIECPYCHHVNHRALFGAPFIFVLRTDQTPKQLIKRKSTDRYLVCPNSKCDKAIGIMSREEAYEAYEDFVNRARQKVE
jgi:hypothetical protein